MNTLGIPVTPPGDEPGLSGLYAELAGALTVLDDQQCLASFSLPYPPAVQLLYDRVVLRCIEQQRTPPASLPDLVQWSRESRAGEEPFAVPASTISPDARLVHPLGRVPTRACLELASADRGGLAAGEAHALLGMVKERCVSESSFRKCRDFLISTPVLSGREPLSRKRRWDDRLWRRVADLYVPVPEFLRRYDVLALCATCELPALLPRDGDFERMEWCESETCRTDRPPLLLRDPGEVMLLRRCLRVFLVLPGRVERSARQALHAAGIPVRSRPDRPGTYELVDSDGTDRVLRSYDRLQPALLARTVREECSDAPECAVVVVPQQCLAQPDFEAAFAAPFPGPSRPALVTPNGLAAEMRPPPHEQKENNA
ncbi:hypothetical protein [Streptomyces pinistramenti]|uniref:pPIWI_RE_Y domain-containing protein n=1 Tax=Streptomyces pinistramenti TaxID=2884812 RepID=UPI001D06C9F3|nr:hypothetical protein [Streptomyces pinistramenti]MCB5909657.1 hypothetical protein [Streptomyces pinistramenti]